MGPGRWIPALRWMRVYDRSWLRGTLSPVSLWPPICCQPPSEMRPLPTCHLRPACMPACSPGLSSGSSAALVTRPLRSRPPSRYWSAPLWPRSPAVMSPASARLPLPPQSSSRPLRDRMGGSSRRNSQLYLRKRHGRLQMRGGPLSRQYAVAETVRAARRAWRLLGEHAPLPRQSPRDQSRLARDGLAALTILILGKIFLKHKPVALFVVIGGIIASVLLGPDAKGVNLLGEVPQGLPAIGIPDVHWSDLKALLPLALACFFLPLWRRLPSGAPLSPSMADVSTPIRSSSLWLRQTSRRALAAAFR